MKLTKTGLTLFQALCEMFIDKAGHNIPKRSFGDHATLVATRNAEGKIEVINLLFRKTKVLEVQSIDNEVFMDATAWFTQATINKLNKVLTLIEMNIRKVDGQWVIQDRSGQQTLFKNAEKLNLSRPHGSAIYVEDVPQAN